MLKDRAILYLALGQTLAWAGLFYLFPALLLRWEIALGWTKAELTAAITMAVLVAAICAPIAGRIIDTGRGPVLMAGAATLGALGLVLLSTVTLLWQFYAVWMVIGICSAGCLYEPCFALVTRARGDTAKRAIVVITLIAGFASTLSFSALHSLSEWLGWRGATLIAAGMVLGGAAPLLYLGASSVQKGTMPADISPPALTEIAQHNFLRRPVFWLLAGGFACLAVAHGAILHHFLPLLDTRGVPAELAVMAASFIGPMQVAGRLAMMAFEKTISLHGITISAFVSLALSAVLLQFAGTSPAMLTGFVILFGGAYGTVSILRPLIAREILGGNNFGAKSGALALPYLVGAATAPYLGALIWQWGGYGQMLVCVAGFATMGCLFYLGAHRSTKTRA